MNTKSIIASLTFSLFAAGAMAQAQTAAPAPAAQQKTPEKPAENR